MESPYASSSKQSLHNTPSYPVFIYSTMKAINKGLKMIINSCLAAVSIFQTVIRNCYFDLVLNKALWSVNLGETDFNFKIPNSLGKKPCP